MPGRSLKILELRKNKLTSCNGLENIDSLEELYLAENEIASISELRALPNLKRLHLRANKLTTLQGNISSSLQKLTYLNLRENQIADL